MKGQYFARRMLLVVPTVHCPAEEAEEKLKAREWHVSGLVVCRASSSSCGNCFSSTPDHCINQGSCWRSLGTEVASPGSSCQTKSELQERERKGSKIHPDVKGQQDTIHSNGPGIWVIQNFARTRNILSGEVSRGPLGLINQFSLVHLLSVRTDHYCSISVLSHAFTFLSRSCYSVVRFPSQRKSRSDFSATQ